PYTLTCIGSGGISPAASTTVAVNAAPAPVSGVCGSANGTTVSSAPSTNLCSAGTASSVAGSGPWTWSCGGSNGGTSASCSASVTVSGGGSTPPSGGSTPPSGGSTPPTGGSTPPTGGGSTPPTTPTPVSGNCGLQLGSAAIFCETFDNKNPGIQSRTGELDPNVWGVSRAAGGGRWAAT